MVARIWCVAALVGGGGKQMLVSSSQRTNRHSLALQIESDLVAWTQKQDVSADGKNTVGRPALRRNNRIIDANLEQVCAGTVTQMDGVSVPS